jgi:hypothetical protein
MTTTHEQVKACPHCQHGMLVPGLSHQFLLRCNNFYECGRYVAESP